MIHRGVPLVINIILAGFQFLKPGFCPTGAWFARLPVPLPILGMTERWHRAKGAHFLLSQDGAALGWHLSWLRASHPLTLSPVSDLSSLEPHSVLLSFWAGGRGCKESLERVRRAVWGSGKGAAPSSRCLVRRVPRPLPRRALEKWADLGAGQDTVGAPKSQFSFSFLCLDTIHPSHLAPAFFPSFLPPSSPLVSLKHDLSF